MASMMNHDVSIGVVTICTRQNSKIKLMIIQGNAVQSNLVIRNFLVTLKLFFFVGKPNEESRKNSFFFAINR